MEVDALPGPADRAAEAGTRPPSESSVLAEPTPGRQSPGRMTVQGPTESSNPPEAFCGEAWAPPVPGQPADPFLAAIEGVQVTVGRLGAAVNAKEGELKAECSRLASEKAQLAGAQEEARVAATREQKLLEDTHAEAARDQGLLKTARAEAAREREDAVRLAEASRQQAAEALARMG